MGVTPTYQLPYPEASEPSDVPTDMHELATATEGALKGQVDPLAARVTALEQQLAAIVVAQPGDLRVSTRGAPSAGWLLCDGTAVSRSTYAQLYTAIGTAYGAGDGATTFNLPDFRGRSIVGVGVHADVNALGRNDGALAANRRPRHRHTVNDPAHVHGGAFYRDYAPGGTTGTPGTTGNNRMYGMDYAYTGISVGPQSGAEPVDTPAYLTANVFIKT